MPRRLADIAKPVLFAGLALAAFAPGAFARTSDRNQPLDVESNSSDCSVADDGPCTLIGDVRLVQGTLNVRAGKAVVHRAGGDIRRVTLSGGPVQMSQELDDGSKINATAANVDYDMYAAIDLLADKLDRLLVKHKEKLIDSHRGGVAARGG